MFQFYVLALKVDDVASFKPLAGGSDDYPQLSVFEGFVASQDICSRGELFFNLPPLLFGHFRFLRLGVFLFGSVILTLKSHYIKSIM